MTDLNKFGKNGQETKAPSCGNISLQGGLCFAECVGLKSEETGLRLSDKVEVVELIMMIKFF